MPQYTKVDANTIQITVQPVVAPVTSTYLYNDLQANLANLQAEKISWNAAQDAKIATAQALVTAADGLGIVAIAKAPGTFNATVIPAQ